MKKRLLCALLGIIVAVTIIPLSGAKAADTYTPAIQMGTSAVKGYSSENGYYSIYLGTWQNHGESQKNPVIWRVLDTKTNIDTDGLFLLSEKLFGKTNAGGIFFNGNDGGDNQWQQSSARFWCRVFAGELPNEGEGAFSTAEYDAILNTYKSDVAYRTWCPAADNILDGEKVFFLSALESEYAKYGLNIPNNRVGYYNGTAKMWLLRSPTIYGEVYVCAIDGGGRSSYTRITYTGTARPALNLNADKVLFTSPAQNGKTAFGLTAVENYSGKEFKLTLLDSSRNAFAAILDLVADNTVSVKYDNATTGQNEYLSTMIMNNGTVKYYGKLKNLDSSDMASGTALISLPESFSSENGDVLYIFNEQCNGDYLTDYASALRQIDLTQKSVKAPQFRIDQTSKDWEISYDGGSSWTSLGVKATGEAGKDGLTPMMNVDANGIWQVSYDNGTTWISLGIAASGQKGDTGDKGDKGDKGDNGKDGITPRMKIDSDGILFVSYDDGTSWVSLGVSLKGEKGDKGDTGDKGDKGDKGDTGSNGADGINGTNGIGIAKAEVNANGELVITFTDKTSVNLGKVVGKDGKDGNDGRSPFIGGNGNWWIGEIDLGVKATPEAIEAISNNVTGKSTLHMIITISAIAGLSLINSFALILYLILKKGKKEQEELKEE